MVLSREDGPGAHPFWYAQIIRAFIIPVINTAPDARNRCQQTIEVLWVRWLGVEPGYRWGFKAARLPKIGFVPETDDNPFGFLDPSLVIRGCHLIPAFSEGRTDSLLKRGESLARQPGETDDWCAFYVNMYIFFPLFHCTLSNSSSFVDRDMFCRFAGIGIGHGTQYGTQSMDGITSDGNTSEDAMFPMADSEDEDEDISHAGQESLFEVPPHDGNTASDNGHDEDGESDSGSDSDSERDASEGGDESGFEF